MDLKPPARKPPLTVSMEYSIAELDRLLPDHVRRRAGLNDEHRERQKCRSRGREIGWQNRNFASCGLSPMLGEGVFHVPGGRMKRGIYVYKCYAIDYWDGWQRIHYRDTEATKFLHRAQEIALAHLEWEGDVNDGPYIAPLPCNDAYCDFMVAWKQKNNGDTFIGCPYALLWLDDGCIGKAVAQSGWIGLSNEASQSPNSSLL
jgi:hypothetical protein